MINFGLRHAGTAKAGGHAVIGGLPYTFEPPRGHAAVSCDGAVWFYRVARGERRKFRVWLAGPRNVRSVGGRWPHYEIRG